MGPPFLLSLFPLELTFVIRNRWRSWGDLGAEPVFFVVLEGGAFAFLFSPLFLGLHPRMVGWSALVVWRAIALGVVVLPSGLAKGGDLGWLKRSCFYQIPFWFSALAFPFYDEQPGFALVALVLQSLSLIGLVGLTWQKKGTAEAWVYGIGWLSCLALRPLGSWLLVSFAGWAIVLGLVRRTGYKVWDHASGLALLIAVICVGGGGASIRVDGLVTELGPLVLLIAGIILVGGLGDALQRLDDRRCEAEAVLPYLSAGRSWRLFSTFKALGGGWVAILALVSWDLNSVSALVVMLFGSWAGLTLSASSRLSPTGWRWWVVLLATLVWLAGLRFGPGIAIFTSLGSLALYAVQARWDSRLSYEVKSELGPESRRISGVLARSHLRSPCPITLKDKVLAEVSHARWGTIQDAKAPTGFRKRLLDRIRRGEDGADSWDRE